MKKENIYKNSKLLSVRTKNFKGLGNFEFIPKSENLSLIYGENGIGKSSLIMIFDFFILNIEKFSLRNAYLKNMQSMNPLIPVPLNENMENTYLHYSQIDNNDPIELELKFKFDNEIYVYLVYLNKVNSIEKEYFYSISKSTGEPKKWIIKKQLNQDLYIDDEIFKIFGILKSEINQSLEDSVISIIGFWFNNNFKKITDSKIINHPIIRLLFSIRILNLRDYDDLFEKYFSKQITILPNFQVNNHDKFNIKRFELEKKEFEEFVTKIDQKIKSINMVRKLIPNSDIEILSLEFVLKVNGTYKNISYNNLSTGTKNYIKYFKLIKLINNSSNELVNTSVILFDEFGINLHPTLLINILNYIDKISKETDTQVIATTHQILFLDKNLTNLSNKQKIIMNKDLEGNSYLKTLENTGNRDNLFKKYLRGDYGGNSLNLKIDIDDN